ncbi:hypothetical protein BDV18DRAFT_162031 [Aspergillus unguis]
MYHASGGLPSPSPTPSASQSSSSSSSAPSSSSSSSESVSDDQTQPVQQQQQQSISRSKPILVIICPTGSSSMVTRYEAMLNKMMRDAHILFVRTLAGLHRVLADQYMAELIAGFVVTDARIMGVDIKVQNQAVRDSVEGEEEDDDDESNEAGSGDGDGDEEMIGLSNVLKAIVTGAYSYERPDPLSHQNPCPNTSGIGNRGLIPAWTHPSASLTVNKRPSQFHEWTVVFAFDFPAQAARHPLRFARYMAETFDVRWRMCGAAKGKWTLAMNDQVLGKLGARVYRGNQYQLRAVFLESVEEKDKVLIVKRGAKMPQLDVGFRKSDQASNDENRAEHELGEYKEDQDSDNGTASTTADYGDMEIERVEVGDRHGWTIAADRNGAIPEDEDTVMTEVEFRPGYDADDESKSPTDPGTQDEDDNTSSSSTSTENTDKRVIFINVPHQRGSRNRNTTDNLPEDKGKERTKLTSKHVEDCPVAIHEVNVRPNGRENPHGVGAGHGNNKSRVRGYVGFVGHIGDNRSMASLILGMCGVQSTRPLPETLQTFLRDNRLG